MADTYLQKAGHYAAVNARFIASDSLFRAVYSELFFLRNADCDKLLADQRYQTAIECYSEFESTYSASELALVKSRLDIKKQHAKKGLLDFAINKTSNAFAKHEDDTSLYYYDLAIRLQHELHFDREVNSRMDSLDSHLAQIRYARCVNSGKQALDKRQFTLSLTWFIEAKKISDHNRIEAGHDFDSLYQRSIRNYLLVQLSNAQRDIWENESRASF